MIILLHPRSTRPKNRRFPLSVLALAAVLEGKEEYEIVDGNADPDPKGTIDQHHAAEPGGGPRRLVDAGTPNGGRG